MTITVRVNKRAAERARGRHAWIYRSDLTDDGGARGGEVVRVEDGRGAALGRALYSSRSQIALRFVAYEDVETDRAFWGARLDAALRLREVVAPGASACRLVYGESDLLPSLIVDRYGDCLVMQTLSQGMEALKPLWVELLVERLAPRAIVERNDARVRDLEGLPRHAGTLYGEAPGEIVCEEDGVRYAVSLLEGQKTGAFLDQRENRSAAAGYTRGRALDCFTFEGGFALHMVRRAARVVAVDISGAALGRARRNAELNGLDRIEWVEANVFDYLRELEHAGERFETINLDPPAFAKNRGAVEAAARGYKEINLRAMKLLAPGGVLITSTCSYHMSEEMFLNILADAAADAARSVKIVEKRGQSRDHPVLLSMPETYYLKCLILRVE